MESGAGETPEADDVTHWTPLFNHLYVHIVKTRPVRQGIPRRGSKVRSLSASSKAVFLLDRILWEETEGEDLAPSRRDIGREENDDQILKCARTTHVEQSPSPFNGCLFTLAYVLFIRFREWFEAEVSVVGELRMGALLVVKDDQHSLEFCPLDSLLRREG